MSAYALANPWLTFFGFCVACQAVVYVFASIAAIFKRDRG